jgi:hypothetical protein
MELRTLDKLRICVNTLLKSSIDIQYVFFQTRLRYERLSTFRNDKIWIIMKVNF